MNEKLTEVVFILDRSGSMGGLESDTIGGFNAFLSKQKALPGEAYMTTVLFDDAFEVLHDHLPLKGVGPLTDQDYYVRGTTALLDAVGKSIQKMIAIQRHTLKEDRASKVMFIITTDGLENASLEYSYSQIKKMIEHQRSTYGWEFLFLGANMDAAAEGAKFGIDSTRTAQYHNDSKGISVNYDAISEATAVFREKQTLSKDWKKIINEDYNTRK